MHVNSAKVRRVIVSHNNEFRRALEIDQEMSNQEMTDFARRIYQKYNYEIDFHKKTRPMKYMIFMLVWKRPEITEIVFQQIKHLQEQHDIQCLVCYSEKSYKKMIKKYGFIPYFHENLPLGEKNNAAVAECLKYEWDVLIQTGSDDLLSENLFDIYDFSHTCGGLDNCYFADLQKNKVSYYQNNLVPVGAGRFFSRFLIERLSQNFEIYLQRIKIKKSLTRIGYAYQPGEIIEVLPDFAQNIINKGLGVNLPITSENQTQIISKDYLDKLNNCSNFVQIKRKIKQFKMWPPQLNRALDTASQNYIVSQGYQFSVFTSANPEIIDLKSVTNIHKISEFPTMDMNFKDLFINFKHLDLCSLIKD